MKIVFMGTSAFAIPTLMRLISSKHELIKVVTQPDRIGGRGNKSIMPPVKELAQKHGIPVFQPAKIRDMDAIDEICQMEIDLIVVVSYGQIIPADILLTPQLGCINVHASLLPKYRGAAPIQRAIMAGEKITGITTMLMDEGLDTGDIIMQVPVTIEDTIDHGELEKKLAMVGADLLADTIAVLDSGSLPRRKQNNNKATYAHMISRADEIIEWQEGAEPIVNRIRALCPNPGAYTVFNNNRFKVFSARVVDPVEKGIAGQIMEISNSGFIAQTGQGTIEILEVQKEGKSRMSCSNFLKGFKLAPGDILGN